jgi:hypothetical protein
MSLRQTRHYFGLLAQHVECHPYCTAELYFEITDRQHSPCASPNTPNRNWAKHIIALPVYHYADQVRMIAT